MRDQYHLFGKKNKGLTSIFEFFFNTSLLLMHAHGLGLFGVTAPCSHYSKSNLGH